MNKQVNQDLKNLKNWLNAKKICINISKTEAVLFKLSKKLTDVPSKQKLNGKRFYPTNLVKYLGTRILIGKKHPKIKLQRLRKIRMWTFGLLVHQINSF